jgi:predicted nucleic acid-binding protein
MNNKLKYTLYLSSFTLSTLFSCADNSVDNNVQIYVDTENNTTPGIVTSTIVVTHMYTTLPQTTNTSIVTNASTITTITTTSTAISEDVTAETDIISDDITIAEFNIDLTDTLIIKDKIIYLTYADATQENIDNYDVVYATGYMIDLGDGNITISDNVYPYTMIFGHDYKSFSILPNLIPGELFYMNVQGSSVTYEIQRSESGYDSDDGVTIYSYSDNIDILFNDYGYEALILITCYGEDRWVIVAKPI